MNTNTAELEAELREKHGQVWTTEQLQAEFEVLGFALGFVVVRRKADGVVGSLEFTHAPRFYYNFAADH